VVSFLLSFSPKSCMHSSSPPFLLNALPSHPPWLDHSNYAWKRVQVMKLLIMHFSPTLYHFIPFYPDILLSTLFSNSHYLATGLHAAVSRQQPLSVMYDILSLINSTLLTADMILLWTKKPVPISWFSFRFP
jgi:hypothetical protein